MNNNWTKDIEELQKKRERLALAGGPDRIAKQHASGKVLSEKQIAALERMAAKYNLKPV